MSDEPELRRDPVTGRWVLIAPERARRPIALSGAGPRTRTPPDCRPAPILSASAGLSACRQVRQADGQVGIPTGRSADRGERTPCPFCPGEEHDTPNEVFAIRAPGSAPNGPGWRLRVVPNKFPAVRADTGRTPSVSTGGLFEAAPAVGFAEVLIDCPEHIDSPTFLSDEQFADVFRAYRERMIALAADPRLAHVAVFKNVGAEAGASLGHTHSQIIATPVVPALIQSELTCAEAYFARTGRCVFCDLVEQELADGKRVVARSERFVVVTAFAPRFAYEMWVLPIRHEPRYESISDAAALELAHLLKRVLRALDVGQHSPAYNWFLHSTPLRAGEPAHYHWHLEILPRTARPAGLEWGYGCHITTVPPECAASELREVLAAPSE